MRERKFYGVFFVNLKTRRFCKMFEYKTVKEDLFSEDLGDFSSFGIKVFLVVDKKYEIGVASDVSDDSLLVERIASYCNRRQVNPLDLLNTVSLFI